MQTVLRNERYAGSNIGNRSSSNLILGSRKIGRVKNHPTQWTRDPIGFEGFISSDMFEKARLIRGHHGKSYRDDQALLDKLRELLRQRGRLNSLIIDGAPNMPTAPVYVRHFGSLRRAYALIGYHSAVDWGALPESQYRQAIAGRVNAAIIDAVRKEGGISRWNGQKRQVTINDHLTIGSAVARNTKRYRWNQWRVVSSRRIVPDIMILARMDIANQEPLDYLCTTADLTPSLLNKTFRDEPHLEPFRAERLDDVVARVMSIQRRFRYAGSLL